MEEAAAALSLRAAVVARLEDLEETTAMRIASVNGFTGNSVGWLETIAAFARRFAHSVFSVEAAKERPPSRPDLACTISVRDEEKHSTCKLYDMAKEQDLLADMVDDKGCELRPRRPQMGPGTNPRTKKERMVRQIKSKGVAKKISRRSGKLWTNSSAKDSSVLQPGQLVACLLRRGQGLPLPGINQMRLMMDYRNLNSKIYLDEDSLPPIRTVISGPSSLPEKARASLTGCIGF
jgi:hypothetical protein